MSVEHVKNTQILDCHKLRSIFKNRRGMVIDQAWRSGTSQCNSLKYVYSELQKLLGYQRVTVEPCCRVMPVWS